MEIRDPCCITSRLRPGVKCGNAEISIEYASRQGSEGRTRYLYHIDIHGGPSAVGDDLESGVGGGSLCEGLESLLSFLAAFASSVRYGDENCDMFPAKLAPWAAENFDELSMLAVLVEEAENCIVE